MTALMLLLALASSAWTGRCALRLFWKADSRGLGPRVTLAALGLGLGLALSGAHFFAWRALIGRPGSHFVFIDLLVLPALMWAASLLVSRRALNTDPARCLCHWRAQDAIVGAETLAAVVVAALAFAALLKWEALGQWDGWAIWNLKARFMFRGDGQQWRGMFSNHVWFSHPDYPLLVPSLVGRFWAYTGHETLWGPWLVAGAFATLVTALLFGLACWLRGPRTACWAVLLLVGSQGFLWYGAAQYSDVPLSFFVLGAAGLLMLSGRSGQQWRLILLTGLVAGWGAFGKNEGILLAAALSAGWMLARCFTRSVRWSAALALVLGMLPGLATVAAQKAAFPARSYLIADQEHEHAIRQKLTDAARYRTVAMGVLDANFGWRKVPVGTRTLAVPKQPMVLCLLFLPLIAGWSADQRDRFARRAVLAWLALALAIYFAVAVVMPYDLERLMLDWPRMQIHVWPVIILWIMTATRIEAPIASKNAEPALAASGD